MGRWGEGEFGGSKCLKDCQVGHKPWKHWWFSEFDEYYIKITNGVQPNFSENVVNVLWIQGLLVIQNLFASYLLQLEYTGWNQDEF